MRLEFALQGLPIDIKAFFNITKKESKDKTQEELLESIQGIHTLLDRADKGTFNPAEFVDVEDAKVIDQIDKDEGPES